MKLTIVSVIAGILFVFLCISILVNYSLVNGIKEQNEEMTSLKEQIQLHEHLQSLYDMRDKLQKTEIKELKKNQKDE